MRLSALVAEAERNAASLATSPQEPSVAARPAEQPPSLEAGPDAPAGGCGEAGPLKPEPDTSDTPTRAREARPAAVASGPERPQKREEPAGRPDGAPDLEQRPYGPPAAPPILPCHLAAAWRCDEADAPWPSAPAACRAELVDYLAAWHRLMVASAHGLADTFDHADPLTAAADDALARCVALLPAGDLAAARRLDDLAIAMWREWCSAGRPGQAELVAAARLDTPGTPPARAKREFLEFAEAGSAAAGGLS